MLRLRVSVVLGKARTILSFEDFSADFICIVRGI